MQYSKNFSEKLLQLYKLTFTFAAMFFQATLHGVGLSKKVGEKLYTGRG